MSPLQVRSYRDDDPLTNGLWRGRLLYARLNEVGYDVADKMLLDVGCGYGGLALAAAERGATVTALDADASNVAVVRRRAEQAAVPVGSIVASATEIPLATGSYDIATMIGVVEWLGYTHAGLPVPTQQVRALAEVRRTLTPHGVLVIGTKNRLYPRYAWSDAQLRKPLVNLLPRRLANLASRRLYGIPYRAYVYSLRGWRRLLMSGGFVIEEVFVPLYTYQYPLSLAEPWTRVVPCREITDVLAEMPEAVSRAALEQQFAARLWYYDAVGRLGLLGLGGGTFLFVCRPR